ncbi:hypothetical protein PENSPDRAFT_479824 [Peniophora sp. CONT]|nr:hypothetical protein PENSPDRAFT_479824 [Peniophora sp. CONT]
MAHLSSLSDRHIATSGLRGFLHSAAKLKYLSEPRLQMSIYALPNEIICEIFGVVAILEPTPTKRSQRSSHMWPPTASRVDLVRELAWIRLGHVCRRWREVLLKMSDLWGRIAFTYPNRRAFSTLLARAAEAPLDIVILERSYDASKLSPEQEELALARIPRARSLTLQRSMEPKLIQCFPAEPMLHLRILDLHIDYYISNYPPSRDRNSAPVKPSRDAKLRIYAPNLKTAAFTLIRSTLSSVHSDVSVIPALRFKLPTLRHLTIRLQDKTTDISDLTWLVSLLQTSPLIEDLTIALQLTKCRPSWDSLFEGRPVRLKHLKHLKLEESGKAHLAPLMHHICRSSRLLSLDAHFGSFRGMTTDFGNEEAEATQFVRSFSGQVCRPTDRAFAISTASEVEGIAMLSGPALDDPAKFVMREDRQPNLENGVEVSIAIGGRSQSYSWFDEFLEGIQNPEHIEQLYVDVNSTNNNYSDWMEDIQDNLLLGMTAVRTVYLSEPFSENATGLDALGVLELDPSQEGVIFPTLETLLVRLELDSTEAPYTSRDTIRERYEEWWDTLASILENRHEEDVPVRTLRILGSWKSQSVREMLRELEEEMLARVMEVVENVVDERMVHPSKKRHDYEELDSDEDELDRY